MYDTDYISFDSESKETKREYFPLPSISGNIGMEQIQEGEINQFRNNVSCQPPNYSSPLGTSDEEPTSRNNLAVDVFSRKKSGETGIISLLLKKLMMDNCEFNLVSRQVRELQIENGTLKNQIVALKNQVARFENINTVFQTTVNWREKMSQDMLVLESGKWEACRQRAALNEKFIERFGFETQRVKY